jgi:hypothetical protein
MRQLVDRDARARRAGLVEIAAVDLVVAAKSFMLTR